MRSYSIGSICSFTKGASVPRDRMGNVGDYLYLHYGDLYKGHELYIDVEDPQKLIPFISHTERIHNNQFIDDGDIVYVLTSETVEDLGKALYLHNPLHRTVVAGTETTVMRILRKDLIHPAWLNYYIQTPRFKKILQQYATGMKVFRVNPRDISLIEIELPSLETQQRSIAILDTIHKKLRINNQINDYLEELFALQYESLVVNSVVEYVPLTEVIFFQEGPGIRNWQYVNDDDGVRFINIRCIQNHELQLASANRISASEAYGKYKHFLVKSGDILMSTSGTLGRYAIARDDHLPLCMNTSVIRFRPLLDEETYAFVYGYLTSNEFYSHLQGMANGSAQVNFGPTHLRQINIPLPSADRIHQFDAETRPIIDSMNKLRSENKTLSELRDELLPKLLSGEIDVSQVDITQLNNHLYECLA